MKTASGSASARRAHPTRLSLSHSTQQATRGPTFWPAPSTGPPPDARRPSAEPVEQTSRWSRWSTHGFLPSTSRPRWRCRPRHPCLHLRRTWKPVVGRAGPAPCSSQSFQLCRSPLRHAGIAGAATAPTHGCWQGGRRGRTRSHSPPGALAPYLRAARSLSPRVRELALRSDTYKSDAAARSMLWPNGCRPHTPTPPTSSADASVPDHWKISCFTSRRSLRVLRLGRRHSGCAWVACPRAT